MGVALITPITFWLDKVDGFAMLMGLWNAAIFAGGITAILINTPGTPASITHQEVLQLPDKELQMALIIPQKLMLIYVRTFSHLLYGIKRIVKPLANKP